MMTMDKLLASKKKGWRRDQAKGIIVERMGAVGAEC